MARYDVLGCGSSRIAGWTGPADPYRAWILRKLLQDPNVRDDDDEVGRVIAWSLEVKTGSEVVCPGDFIDFIIDSLTCLWEYAKDKITRADPSPISTLQKLGLQLRRPGTRKAAKPCLSLTASALAGHTTWTESPRPLRFIVFISWTSTASSNRFKPFAELNHRRCGRVLLFTSFNIEDPHGPTVGFFNGQLPISGSLAQRAVFDPVVDQVLQLLGEELPQFDQPIHVLLPVGGLAGSEHSKQCIGVKLPAEQEDWQKTPANSTAGVVGCATIGKTLYWRERFSGNAMSRYEFNLSMLSGDSFAIRSKSSQSPSDPSFVPTLYAGKTDKILRCTNEDGILQLCKWST
ncbi:hypothetical protein EST38_g13938 [Candolleomyces aberdarensis]|uniref:Uncharacterized protein n=1 Tax=Candolleomyces aberdarensis TaxID=2316362 RepID=A0A4Q2CYK7_9AGAR|nr:hypothetical protein EST38_g13938 [Candolleomyces aberdarensis]